MLIRNAPAHQIAKKLVLALEKKTFGKKRKKNSNIVRELSIP